MPKTISIHDLEFSVPAPYGEGHTITANEAYALNQTFAENIANVWRKKIKEAIDAENPDEAVASVRTKFDAYAAEYEFSGPRVSAATATPLEKAALRQARAWLVQQLKETDYKTLKAYKEAAGEEAVEDKINEIAAHSEIVKLAKDELKRAENRAGVKIDLAAAVTDAEE